IFDIMRGKIVQHCLFNGQWLFLNCNIIHKKIFRRLRKKAPKGRMNQSGDNGSKIKGDNKVNQLKIMILSGRSKRTPLYLIGSTTVI
ncbi:MAG TPA: hypothetical protein VGD26_13420, partial [Chitinophagaceae bacterium]